MVKIGGAVFATPKRTLLVLESRISQQIEIAALHQLHSGACQTDGAIAQLVCLPGGAGRNTRAAE